MTVSATEKNSSHKSDKSGPVYLPCIRGSLLICMGPEAKAGPDFKLLGHGESRLERMPAIPDTSDEESAEDDRAKNKAKNLSSGAQDKSGGKWE